MNIRKAKRTDLAAIYQLVVELAIFEKEPDAVKATLEEYQQSWALLTSGKTYTIFGPDVPSSPQVTHPTLL